MDFFADAPGKDLAPVGRLDKDTTGLLLITNDGSLAHRLLSPKDHVPKVYTALVDGYAGEEEKEAFAAGIRIDDEFTALHAELDVLSAGSESSLCRVTVYEGKFHQVKRMFEALGLHVLSLRRIAMGPLTLDESLAPGEFRPLTKEETDLTTGFKG